MRCQYARSRITRYGTEFWKRKSRETAETGGSAERSSEITRKQTGPPKETLTGIPAPPDGSDQSTRNHCESGLQSMISPTYFCHI